MKQNGIWIDYRNKEQVKWWNNVASKLVRVVQYNEIIETATGKAVGRLIMIKGLHKNRVIKENLKFIDKPVTKVIEVSKNK
jgi:hypothetical protein